MTLRELLTLLGVQTGVVSTVSNSNSSSSDDVEGDDDACDTDTASLWQRVRALEPSSATACARTTHGNISSSSCDLLISAEAAEVPGESSTSTDDTAAPTKALAFHHPTAKFMLRAVRAPDGTHRLYLNWCTNAGNPAHRHPILCQHCEVRECTGGEGETEEGARVAATNAAVLVGQDESARKHSSVSSSRWWADRGKEETPNEPSRTACDAAVHTSTSSAQRAARPPMTELECALYMALANAGGSYAWTDFMVEACFDGAVGTWHILRQFPAGRRKNEASFESLLQHLSWLACGGLCGESERMKPRSHDGVVTDEPHGHVAPGQSITRVAVPGCRCARQEGVAAAAVV